MHWLAHWGRCPSPYGSRDGWWALCWQVSSYNGGLVIGTGELQVGVLEYCFRSDDNLFKDTCFDRSEVPTATSRRRPAAAAASTKWCGCLL
jgi:hypothetical protein